MITLHKKKEAKLLIASFFLFGGHMNRSKPKRYKSKRWQLKREKILRRDKYMCQLSKRYGKRVDATMVHHIYPIEEYPEYKWCDWNLISLCESEHNKLHDRVTNKLTAAGEELKRRTIPPLKNN